MEKLEHRHFPSKLWRMETVDCQGFQLSPYAAALAEREGIDVGLLKRNLDLTPLERLEQAQEATNAVKAMMEAGKRYRDGL